MSALSTAAAALAALASWESCAQTAIDVGWVGDYTKDLSYVAGFGECQWFAGCGHPASRWVQHPVLGAVATCACNEGGHPEAER